VVKDKKSPDETSGLSDLRTMAAASATPPAVDEAAPGDAPPTAAALLADGARPSLVGMRVPTPATEAAEGASPRWVWWTIGGIGAVAVAVVAVALGLRNDSAIPVGDVVNQPPRAPAAPETTPPRPQSQSQPEPESPAEKPASSRRAAPTTAFASARKGRREDTERRTNDQIEKDDVEIERTGEGQPVASAEPPAASAAPAAKPPAGDLDELLKSAMGTARVRPRVAEGKAKEAAVEAGGAAAAAAEAKPAAPKERAPAEDIKSVLEGLASKVRQQCFKRFQIAGAADVTAVVAPTGKLQSASLKGDFLETPTGNCVVGIVRGAVFLPFAAKAAPVSVGHTFLLR